MKLLSVREAARLMDYRPRTFITWSKKHSLNIFTEEGLRKKYVLESEYLAVRNQNLKDKSGVSLHKYLQSVMKVFSSHTAERESIDREKVVRNGVTEEIQHGENEEGFTGDLHKVKPSI